MKWILGALALIAAVILVACSATTLFLTAFNAFKEPWQQWLNGAGMAAIVAYEAGAVLIIGYCFKKRHIFVGIGTLALLIAAMAVTSRQELRLYVVGQADVTAGRTVVADDRKRVRAELERAYLRRDQLQGLDHLTKSQTAELTALMARIGNLEQRWDTRTEDVKATGNAEGELAHQMFGLDADLSQAFLNTLPLWFWLLARVFSIPGVVIALSAMAADRKANRAAANDRLHSADDNDRLHAPAVTVRPREPMRAISKITGVSLPEIPDNSPITALSDTKPTLSDTNPEPPPATAITKPASDSNEPDPICSPNEHIAEPDTTVVEGPWPDKPSRREKLKAKRERMEHLHGELIGRFFAETQDAVIMDRTDNDGWKSGGTPARAVHADYKAWCKQEGEPWLHPNTFGRYVSDHVDVAPSAKGKQYGCKRRVVKTIAKRKVA